MIENGLVSMPLGRGACPSVVARIASQMPRSGAMSTLAEMTRSAGGAAAASASFDVRSTTPNEHRARSRPKAPARPRAAYASRALSTSFSEQSTPKSSSTTPVR